MFHMVAPDRSARNGTEIRSAHGLATNEPSERRVEDTADGTATSTPRLQTLEARSAAATTGVATRFRSQRASDCKPTEKSSESCLALKFHVHIWMGALPDDVTRIVEIVETKKGRLAESDSGVLS